MYKCVHRCVSYVQVERMALSDAGLADGDETLLPAGSAAATQHTDAQAGVPRVPNGVHVPQLEPMIGQGWVNVSVSKPLSPRGTVGRER